jgi:hypothetical protein
MQISIIQTIPVLALRVSELFENISWSEMINSDLGYLRLRLRLSLRRHTSFPSSQLIDAYVRFGMKWDGRIDIAIELRAGISGEGALNLS